jgi:histidinol phosphatase-like PHP family hydrolase
MGVTDHSYGLPIARGMSMSAVARQHQDIDRVNDRFKGRFRVFKGIEANILADGSLERVDVQSDTVSDERVTISGELSEGDQVWVGTLSTSSSNNGEFFGGPGVQVQGP